MTRYARAKGSKASNERIPEPATPWSEMRQQLLEKKKEEDSKEQREEINAQRLDSYKKFLNEHEVKESKKTKWAEFPGVKKPQKESKLKKKKTIEKLREGADAFVNGNDGTNKVGKKKKNKELDRIVDEEFNKLKLKLDKVLDEDELHNDTQDSDNDPPEELSSKVELPEIKIKKARQKKKLKILSNAEKDLNEKHLDDEGKNNSNETNDPQIEKEITESETNQEKKKKKKKKRPVPEENSYTQIEEGPIKKKSKKSSENNQTSENGEVEKGPLKKKSKATLGKKEKKLQFSEGNIKNTNNTEQNAEISMKKLARKERKKKRQWEKRQLKKAQKQAEKESQNTDVISVNGKNFSDQQNQKQSKGHPNKISVNENEMNNFKEKPKFTKNQNQSHNNISKPVSKENKTKSRLDGADGETVAKKKKVKEEKTRRKPLGPETMTINGQNVEIEFVDGFPVKKEDAVRLKQLRKQMISKGLPRSEINKALKLERRRAEKALARLKRVVCFNCRKTGHNLSECPEVGKDELAQSMAVDICFKCGSTEHKSYECKVVRGDNFKHATCFICKEQGHISRQCPDNPRGLYPKGGACKVCGDVTHLKKDCPEYQAHQQQQGGVKVDVINDSNLEDLGESNDKTLVKKRVNKVIKF